jgi:glycosyltransferase involved in cell wall biosynthesis
MPPLVSILIPAYNAQEWIADTIKSALEQTWPRKEIIIVDDGSADRTVAISQQFASRSVCIVSQENHGVSAARNKALSLCQGDYIQWLDADDLLAPEKIEKQMETAMRCQSPRTLFSSAWGYFFYRSRKAQFTPTPLWCDLSPVEWLTNKMGQSLHMQTGTWLVSRKLTEAAGPWDTRLWRDNDGEYFCRVVLASDGIRFVPEAKVFYRTTDASRVSHIGRSDKKLESLFLSMRLHVGYLRSLEDSSRTREACLAYLQTWLVNFYPERPDIVSQLNDLAANLGGQLQIPSLSWKYVWLEKIFGWRLTKQVRGIARANKEAFLKSWDKILFQWEQRRVTSTINKSRA